MKYYYVCTVIFIKNVIILGFKDFMRIGLLYSFDISSLSCNVDALVEATIYKLFLCDILKFAGSKLSPV